MAKDSFRGLSYNADKLPCGCCRCCGCSCPPLIAIHCDLCDSTLVSGTDAVQIVVGKVNTPEDRYDRREFKANTGSRYAFIMCQPCADKKLRELFTTEYD